MKNFFLGILLVVILGIGSFAYRSAVEHPSEQIVCPMDALVCPDGTAVSRTGSSCVFAACPPPNVSIPEVSISFALPEGFLAAEKPDATTVAMYSATPSASSALSSEIAIRRYSVEASSTPLETIKQTALDTASGQPIGASSFTSTVIGSRRYTVVNTGRDQGVVETAYYLSRATDVLRFEAIDTGVTNWSDTDLNVSSLRAHSALVKLLSTLQGK